ncbi:MAG TPA: hypothetical protein VGP46_10030 [Acidimicrobiales bacterium]|nr:hypothetical protein [Acidimicrobiales bacterium]
MSDKPDGGDETRPEQPLGGTRPVSDDGGQSGRRPWTVRHKVLAGVGLLVVASVVAATVSLAAHSPQPRRGAGSSGGSSTTLGAGGTNAGVSSSTSPPGSTTGGSTGPNQPTPTTKPPTTSPGGLPPVTHPTLGVDLYSAVAMSKAAVLSHGARIIAAAKQQLGINSIGIVWALSMPNNKSDSIGEGPDSLSLADIVALTKLAEQQGLSVQYRPLIRVGKAQNWAGVVLPTDPAAWFQNFFNAELPFLRAAVRYHVHDFVIESELVRMNDNPGWAKYIKRVEKNAPGVNISYAASEGNYFPGHNKVRQLLPTQTYGMDAYMPMPASIPSSASVAQLESGWDAYFASVPNGILNLTTMEEVGIAGVDGAYQHPSNWNLVGQANPAVQANWFTAACHTVAQFKMRGIYFYNINLGNNPPYWPSSPVVFMGKPAVVAALRGCATMFGES